MLDWWTRNYTWLALPAFIGVILASYFSPLLTSENLCEQNEVCIREWISALSGWAAVVAAIITVHFMRVQIAETNRHQQENVQLTVMDRLAAARNFKEALRFLTLDGVLAPLHYFGSSGSDRLRSSSQEFGQQMRDLHEIGAALQDDRIKVYESEIGMEYPSSMAKDMLEYLSIWAEQAQLLHGHEEALPSELRTKLRAAADDVLRNIETFAEVGRYSAEQFINKWEARIAE